MNAAVRAVLEGAIDYAGLFPPASLAMPEVVANYASYRAGPDAWALGRLVVPVARLVECVTAARSNHPGDGAWRLAALVADPAALASLEAFNEAHHGRFIADVAEGKAAGPAQVEALTSARPAGVTLYVELTPDGALDACVAQLARAGAGAKIRMGGVVPEAFPSPDEVVRFMRACHEAGVPFKATAGLHHPLRGTYRLTYEPDAPIGTMYGYLNVFLAAAAMRQGMSDASVRALLIAADARGDTATLRVDGQTFHVDTIVRGRGMLPAFGSCSFREPLDDLAALGRGLA